MTRVTADWLTNPATRAVVEVLSGTQAFFVGGCVRNTLLGEPVSDIDMATDATPQEVAARAKAAGLKAIPTGIEHGTITLVSEGIPYEVTTFRRDVTTDGRRATVAFTASMEEDAARRDFTMNALYADAEGEVHDPVGGLPDLAARQVRFIGDAEQRIREDYLRILRFFRFFAWYGRDGIDAEGLAACAAQGEGMDGLARERVGTEMLKLLAAPNPGPAVGAMAQAGLLARVLPGAGIAVLLPLLETEAQLSLAPDPIRRLAALGGEEAPERLRLSKAHARALAELTEHPAGPPAALGYRFGADQALNILALRYAAESQPVPADTSAGVTRGAEQSFPVKASDLPGLKGAEIGKMLKQLEQTWVASDFRLSKADLLSAAAAPE